MGRVRSLLPSQPQPSVPLYVYKNSYSSKLSATVQCTRKSLCTPGVSTETIANSCLSVRVQVSLILLRTGATATTATTCTSINFSTIATTVTDSSVRAWVSLRRAKKAATATKLQCTSLKAFNLLLAILPSTTKTVALI